MRSNIKDLHLFAYQTWWMTSSGQHILWKDIEDVHLDYIKKMLFRRGCGPFTDFPHTAMLYCLKECSRRDKLQKDEYQYYLKLKNKLGIKEGEPMNHTQMNPPMNQPMQQAPTPQPITVEELKEFFGKKVRTKSNGVGIVVAIYHSEYERSSMNYCYNIKIKLDKGGTQQCNTTEVELVNEVELYLYEHKNGTVEWTSKQKIPATMKRMKIKLLTTKMIEV